MSTREERIEKLARRMAEAEHGDAEMRVYRGTLETVCAGAALAHVVPDERFVVPVWKTYWRLAETALKALES